MYVVTSRTAMVRNVAVAVVNGGITLVLLLIAPLGLAAVIVNSLLVAFASYGTATFADRVIVYLQKGRTNVSVEGERRLAQSDQDDSLQR